MFNNIQITLLTSAEYEKHKSIIPLINSDWWWLKDVYHKYRGSVHCVNDNGALDYYYRCYYFSGVRPVLKMDLANIKSLHPGEHIRIGSKSFTILSWEADELVALCDEFIDTRRFNADSNEWETSELKQWLETEGLKLIF